MFARAHLELLVGYCYKSQLSTSAQKVKNNHTYSIYHMYYYGLQIVEYNIIACIKARPCCWLFLRRGFNIINILPLHSHSFLQVGISLSIDPAISHQSISVSQGLHRARADQREVKVLLVVKLLHFNRGERIFHGP